MEKNNIKWMQLGVNFVLALLLVFVFTSIDCKAQVGNNKHHNYVNPLLNISTPEKQGMDSELLIDMLEKIKTDSLKVRSIIIIRNGHLVLESYTHPYDKDVLHDVKSVSKSIISALVGIALRENIIEGVDQKVSDILPEYFEDADSVRKEL
ncbi:MAG: serine hydrolase, partial [Ignavibacteria bacterium]